MAFQIAKLFMMGKILDIGLDNLSLQPRKITERHLADAFLITAMTGYGKTRLVENIAVQLSKERGLIVFDSRGEHRNLKYINSMNKDGKGGCIPDLLYIPYFGFKISDMTNIYDWLGLGLTHSGARICANNAKMIAYHNNEFEKFMGMIDDIPYKGKNSEFYMTIQSIKSRLKSVRRCFVEECVDITNMPSYLIQYKGTPFYVSDWKRFIIKHRHLCINFNSENNPSKAQFFAGKILRDISPVLNSANPFVIVLEEAHFLFPAEYSDDDVPYSAEQCYSYLKSKHKDSTKLIFVTQYPHQLNKSALDETKWYFIGKLENVEGHSKLDNLFKMSSKLQYNPNENLREWLCVSPVYNEEFTFLPYESYTWYEERK